MTLPPRPPAPLTIRRRPQLRRALLQSASVSAMIVAAAAIPPNAHAAPNRTLGQAVATATSAAVTSAAVAGGATAAQAAGLGAQNLATAAARFQSLNQALAGASWTGAAVPDGVAPGGLQQAAGVSGSTSSTLWTGANTSLTQTLANGTTDVTVTQTSSTAVLTWQTFNVGAHTKLTFNQSAGGSLASSWIAINSVQDPNANPTTILGEISAPGKVFILNRNGILFGAGARVDLGGLIATTASIAPAQLTTSGTSTSFSLYGSATGTTTASSFTPTFVEAPDTASIIVQPGAIIQTPYPTGTNGGGYVMLLAANVQNGGSISTPEGQTVLAAGNQFILQPGYSTSNITATVIGSAIDAQTLDAITGTGTTALGAVTNSGVVVADQGDITLDGHLVTQAGVLLSTTTVDERGTVHLLTDTSGAMAASSEIVLTPTSVTEIVPLELYSVGGTLETTLRDPYAAQQGTLVTALDAQRASAISNSTTANANRSNPTGPQLADANTLADAQGESRVEISTGGSVDVQGGALVLAQGGQVAVGAPNIVLETGSTIDVSGVNAQLAAGADDLFISGIVPYYLRDSAANRTGGLEFQNVYIDERTLVEIASGSYAGNIYTQGGLLEVSGNLGLVGYGIEDWSALGGQVTLQAVTSENGVSTGGNVSIAAGATINLTGGTVTYDAGIVQQSYVQAADGRIFNINDAPGDLVYTGVYTGETETHARWHITQTFVNPLLTPSEIMQSAYTIGRDAGTLVVGAESAQIDGTVDAGVTVGSSQYGTRPSNVSDPFTLAQTVAPQAGSLEVGAYQDGSLITPPLFASAVVIGNTSGNNTPPPAATMIPDSVTGTISISGSQLSADGFANITVLTAGDLSVQSAITVANGGTVTLGGGTVEVGANITARGGTIALTTELVAQTISLGPNPGSITLSTGVQLDASGMWVNAQLDPLALTQASAINGGAVSIISTGGVDLQAGSTIDVTGGAVYSDAGKITAGTGGNVTISADIVPTAADTYDPAGNVVIASTIKGYSAGSGGTLSISVPEILFGSLVDGYPQNLQVLNPGAVLTLANSSMFSEGFGDYVLNGYEGLEVDSGQNVQVIRPTYQLAENAGTIATGAATSDVFNVVLPSLYTPAKGGDTITQRAGASLALESTIYPDAPNGLGGPVYIAQGASVAVDPLQSITVASYGQLTDLGTLTAHGGTVTLANTRYQAIDNSGSPGINSNYQDGLSIWVGSGALVDVSGQAINFTDAQGRVFGQAQNGGSIFLGALGGTDYGDTVSTYAQVIVQAGATLDAQGASATVNVAQGLGTGAITSFATPQVLSGNGGLISARSLEGVALDGTMLAQGAGPGAAGGTLVIRIDPQNLESLNTVLPVQLAPSIIEISQDMIPVQTEAGLQPGDPTDPATVGLGRISQQQINAGGFDTLQLYAQDAITFDGSVALHLARSVTFESGIIGSATGAGTDSVTAPFVSFVGFGGQSGATNDYNPSGPNLQATGSIASLTVNADLIDFNYRVVLGGDRTVGAVTSNGTATGMGLTAYAPGFATADFNSTGDIRLDGNSAGSLTLLASADNITLTSAQLYPQTGASAAIYAGDNINAADDINRYAGGTLTIQGLGGALPQAPLSVGGTLTLVADTVVQDGVVRAPEGVINLGFFTGSSDPNGGTATYGVTDAVILGAGSVTSVSLYGETVPYGGTVDGVNYLYNGAAVGTFNPAIDVSSATFTALSGSTIDLRGGGTLSGAGFIPGRGGTADVNKTPLLNSASGTVVANTSDPIFAILPGYTSDYAPNAPGDAGYDTPTVGEQITIRAGEVAGLTAGTYTLLPAYYDLLPGAFRVELTSAVLQPGTSSPFGNFTTLAAVSVGTADTGIESSVPVGALITSGTGVRQLSQYDEETYNTFEVNSAATTGSPRAALPQDAKTLEIQFNAPGVNGDSTSDTGSTSTESTSDTPLSIAAGTVLAAPAAYGAAGAQSVGYGATVEIAGEVPLEILGTGDSVTPIAGSALTAVGITTAALAYLTAPIEVSYSTAKGVETEDAGTRLVLGGTVTVNSTTPDLQIVQGETPDVVIQANADLTAASVILTSANSGTITVAGGATISTLGQGTDSYGLAQGYYYNSDVGTGAYPVLTISNSQLVFTPNLQTAAGASIVIGAGTTLQAGTGSLNFVAPSGTNVQIGDATLAAQQVNVQVANINFGSQADLTNFAALLPGGFSLTQDTLNILAANATVLDLTAVQAVNMLGNIALDSGTTDLVINTPAIYGYGISAGAASEAGNVSITAPHFTWGGVSANDSLSTTGSITLVSASPGGMLAGSSNGATLTRARGLTVDADTITLGYGPDSRVNDQTQLDRLAVGFGNVTLQASTEITANTDSSLSVYQAQPGYGEPGVGGTLTLVTPLVTADSGTILKLAAGSNITAVTGGFAQTATGSIVTLGATIDLTAGSTTQTQTTAGGTQVLPGIAGTVDIGTSFALPAGELSITTLGTGGTNLPATTPAIELRSTAVIDLAGRATGIFDQTANSNGGTLIMEAYAGTAGNIVEDAGAVINVSSPGAAAGSIAATALGGTVSFNGTLDGNGATRGGSFAVAADDFGTTGTQTGFDAMNTTLDAGGFTYLRSFELGSGDITVDQTVTAHDVAIETDAGSIDVVGTIDASGATVGSIVLAAQDNVTLESTALLDAHASKIVVDSYDEEIDAENRAHVTLSSAAGTVTLDPGAAINVSYPDPSNPQGQVEIDAPRTSDDGTVNGVAVSAPGGITITGAQSINLFAFTTYTPTDPNGTIVQDNGDGSTVVSGTGTVGLVQIDLANQAYMTAVNANAASLETQLAGLIKYGTSFNLAPGVIIASSSASSGNLTISGDLDFSTFRYSDPAGFGLSASSTAGSGEPGSIVFRAAGDLTINGSVSDGFSAPPDETSGTTLSADTSGWTIISGSSSSGVIEPTNADLLLPSGTEGVFGSGKNEQTTNEIVLLGGSVGAAITTFDTVRPISLNYDIVINPANLKADIAIPFAVTVGTGSAAIPAGGWVATASITRNGVVLYTAGQLIPAGFQFQTGDVLGAGTVLPISVQTGETAGMAGQLVPAGTSLTVFYDSSISLAANTNPLPVNALIPSNTLAVYGGVFNGTDEQLADVELRQTQTIGGNSVQGYLYPLAEMLPAGSLSWNMNFVAGADLAAASTSAVLPATSLQGGANTAAAAGEDQAAGSLLIDDQHYYAISWSAVQGFQYGSAVAAFSVIRTGTGNLSLQAGGNIDQSSLYGIYTAGTQDPLGNSEDAQFNLARQTLGADGLLLPGSKTVAPVISALISGSYQAYYPNDGGDLVVLAGGNLTSDVLANSGSASTATPSDAVGNWLFVQGSTTLNQATAWWINFGTLAEALGNAGVPDGTVQMVGFTGFGALGGGNVTVTVGGDAGQITDRDEAGDGESGLGPQIYRGEGLVIAVGGTGRLLPGSTTPITTGGGDITLTIGGTLNPLDAAPYGVGATATSQSDEPQAVNGDLIDVRGDISVTAGAIGRIDYVFNSGVSNINDPRTLDPFLADNGVPNGGIVVVPGDGTVDITTDRDLVLGGAGDPGRESPAVLVADPASATGDDIGVFSGFTLWQPTTSITLFSAGGNVTPSSVPNYAYAPGVITNAAITDFRSEYPPTLLVTAAAGDLIYGQNLVLPGDYAGNNSGLLGVNYSLETMPSPDGQVEFLAGKSIFANGYSIDLSGANPLGLSLPTDPAFVTVNASPRAPAAVTNIITDPGTNQSPDALFALEADTPTTNLHADDPQPARFYAADGDIVNFRTGETLDFVNGGTLLATWYIAAKPVWIEASNDIVSTGTRPLDYVSALVFSIQENQYQAAIPSASINEYSSGDLFLNNNAGDISVISAGRDILSAYAYIGGPGLLEVDAGRNLYQAALSLGTTQELFFGSFKSLGDDLILGSPVSLTSGAGIDVLAGVGSAGPDYTAFADLYFNPANQANLAIPITDPSNKGKVQEVYTTQLVAWLAANYGYTGGETNALAAFLALPAIDQAVFVRSIYFDELAASAAEESDPNSRFYKSYVRGKQAIDTLFPSIPLDNSGVPTGYNGAITMYSGTVTGVYTDAADTNPAVFDGGISTLYGGTVQVLDPGGAVEFGIPGGPAPGNSSGIVTYGSGDVDIYALGSVLLGKSRIFTTAGGNITIWSSDGDINAGIGAKTTVSYNPPVLLYDAQGDVTQTPPASSSGAGIATLQPLASVPAGDVNLIAPFGTIDAGEAGIRVSGNLVLAAARVSGTANITVKGSTAGAPTVSVASLGAVEAAGAAAGASTAAANSANQRNTDTQQVSSVVDVDVLSIGGSYEEERRKRKHAQK